MPIFLQKYLTYRMRKGEQGLDHPMRLLVTYGFHSGLIKHSPHPNIFNFDDESLLEIQSHM